MGFLRTASECCMYLDCTSMLILSWTVCSSMYHAQPFTTSNVQHGIADHFLLLLHIYKHFVHGDYEQGEQWLRFYTLHLKSPIKGFMLQL